MTQRPNTFHYVLLKHTGLPGCTSGKETACQCRRLKKQQVQSLGVKDPL